MERHGEQNRPHKNSPAATQKFNKFKNSLRRRHVPGAAAKFVFFSFRLFFQKKFRFIFVFLSSSKCFFLFFFATCMFFEKMTTALPCCSGANGLPFFLLVILRLLPLWLQWH